MPDKLGFKAVKSKVIADLKSGNFRHDPRDALAGKNWLNDQRVTLEEAVALVRRCRGDQYQASPRHLDPTTTVHILKPRDTDGTGWYIKFFFRKVEPDVEITVFISFHP